MKTEQIVCEDHGEVEGIDLGMVPAEILMDSKRDAEYSPFWTRVAACPECAKLTKIRPDDSDIGFAADKLYDLYEELGIM